MSKRSSVKGFSAGLDTLVGLAAWVIPALRITPAERERRRRLAVNASGRLGSAKITDVHDCSVSYVYWIAGVEYAASQDVTSLKDTLPPDLDKFIQRPVGLKYLPHNPVNSIIVCEEWSGLGAGPQGNAS
jgi:hypothetical protein